MKEIHSKPSIISKSPKYIFALEISLSGRYISCVYCRDKICLRETFTQLRDIITIVLSWHHFFVNTSSFWSEPLTKCSSSPQNINISYVCLNLRQITRRAISNHELYAAIAACAKMGNEKHWAQKSSLTHDKCYTMQKIWQISTRMAIIINKLREDF